MLYTHIFGILLCVAGSFAFYDSNSDVVELTPSNFDDLVTKSEEVWLVEFYAPWCGHCKNLIPEYNKAAKALKGIAKVGALDADKHNSFAHSFGVTGFPTLKIFKGKQHTPYQGQRTAEKFIDAVINAAKEKAYDSLGKKPSKSSDKLYGHSIVWKTVIRNSSTTTTKKSTTKPISHATSPSLQNNTQQSNRHLMNLARLNELQLQLFRRKLKDSGVHKIIKGDFLRKNRILNKLKKKNIPIVTARKNILKRAK